MHGSPTIETKQHILSWTEICIKLYVFLCIHINSPIANLCCVRQHIAGRGQTEHGSHQRCSRERCTPCLKMAYTERERGHVIRPSTSLWFSVKLIKQSMHLLLCVFVRVAAAVFSSSVMFCSVSSDTLHFSITTISISVCKHTHTQYSLY